MSCIFLKKKKKKAWYHVLFLYDKRTAGEVEKNPLYLVYINSLGQKRAFSILPRPVCLLSSSHGAGDQQALAKQSAA